MSEIITREAAMARGEKRYFTGVACQRGHIAERHVATRGCVECARESDRRRRDRDRARVTEGSARREPSGPSVVLKGNQSDLSGLQALAGAEGAVCVPRFNDGNVELEIYGTEVLRRKYEALALAAALDRAIGHT